MFVHVYMGEGLTLCNVGFGFGPKYCRLTKQCFGIVSPKKVSLCVCVTRRWNDCNGGTQEGVDGIFKQIIDQFHTHPSPAHTLLSLILSLPHSVSRES